MIRYFGVGSTRVVKGSVVRVLALIEHVSPDETSIRRVMPPIVKLVGEDFQDELKLSFQTILTETDSPGVVIGSFIADVDTSKFPPGGYELELRVDHDEVTLDEFVWILKKEDYIKLLEEEVLQADLSEQSDLLDRTNANQQLVQRLVRAAVHEKLEGFLRLRYKLAIVPAIEVSFDGMPRSSLNLIAYLAEVFADECRAVLIHGVESYTLGVAFSAQLYQFSLSARLDTFTSVTEADLPGFDLMFLRELFDASHTELQLNVAAEVIKGFASLTVAMRQPHSIAAGPHVGG